MALVRTQPPRWCHQTSILRPLSRMDPSPDRGDSSTLSFLCSSPAGLMLTASEGSLGSSLVNLKSELESIREVMLAMFKLL